MGGFHKRYLNLIRQNKPKPQTNLNRVQLHCLNNIQNDKRFIIIPTDKNLGPSIWERESYVKNCLDEHLLDPTTYQRLDPETARHRRYNTRAKLKQLVRIAGDEDSIDPADIQYFKRSFGKTDLRCPQFYATPKVHKTPLKTRPVVSCINSFNEIVSKWLDYQLQRVIHLCPSYIKDSNEILNDMQKLEPLPPGARLFTADATAMYTNIDTKHGIQTIQKWLEKHKGELPPNYPSQLIVELLEIVMTDTFQP